MVKDKIDPVEISLSSFYEDSYLLGDTLTLLTINKSLNVVSTSIEIVKPNGISEIAMYNEGTTYRFTSSGEYTFRYIAIDDAKPEVNQGVLEVKVLVNDDNIRNLSPTASLKFDFTKYTEDVKDEETKEVNEVISYTDFRNVAIVGKFIYDATDVDFVDSIGVVFTTSMPDFGNAEPSNYRDLDSISITEQKSYTFTNEFEIILDYSDPLITYDFNTVYFITGYVKTDDGAYHYTKTIQYSVRAMLEQKQISTISESFGDYALSEDAQSIRSRINDIVAQGSCSITEMNEIITSIKDSNLSESTQRILVKKIFNIFNEADEEEFIEEGIAMLGNTKFDGDPVKNAEYIALLKEMDKFVAHLVDLLDADFEIADDILKILETSAKSAKNKEDIDKCISNCLNRFDAGNKKYNQDLYKEYYQKFVKFNKIGRSFNNRYSKITMAEKKIIDEKFDKILGTLYGDIIRDWFKFEAFNNTTPKTDKLNAAWLKLKEVDRDKTVELSNRILNPMYNYLAKSWSQTVNNINYMRRILGIELEDTVKWKIVHKLYK